MTAVEILTIIASFGSVIFAGASILYSKRLNNLNKADQKLEDMKKWFKETIETMKILQRNFMEKDFDKTEFNQVMSRLSSDIDMGRLYFPNIIDDKEYGKDKPKMFRGHRVMILDLLVMYYSMFAEGKQCGNEKIARNIQRGFVSEVGTYINENDDHTKLKAYTKVDKSRLMVCCDFDNQKVLEGLKNFDICSVATKMSEQGYNFEDNKKNSTTELETEFDYKDAIENGKKKNALSRKRITPDMIKKIATKKIENEQYESEKHSKGVENSYKKLEEYFLNNDRDDFTL